MLHKIITGNGDILNVTKGLIVHGCNARGSMGAGIAKSICDRYPIVKDCYVEWYENYGLRLGEVQYVQVADGLIIANAITQLTYGRSRDILYADYTAIRTAFVDVNRFAARNNLKVHYPLIGCGLANGKWPIVSQIIKDELRDHSESYLWLYNPKN